MKYILDKFFEKTKGFYPFFKYCPKKYHIHYINRRASETLGYEYNYLKPETLNEKIRWLIYNEKLNIKSLLTDKIKVKTYITEKIGEGHCSPIYGIWDSFEDINFSYLPEHFVLKANHGWNMNLFIDSKKQIRNSKKSYKKITKKWLNTNYEQYSLEPQYKTIEPKLFIERLEQDKKNYKCDFLIHCFNGIPQIIEAHKPDRSSDFYDTSWNILPYVYKGFSVRNETPKPGILEEMLEYSKILAEGFSYVRIDFLRLPKKTVALEMTFTPYSAMIPFSNKAFDIELGKLIKLPVPSV